MKQDRAGSLFRRRPDEGPFNLSGGEGAGATLRMLDVLQALIGSNGGETHPIVDRFKCTGLRAILKSGSHLKAALSYIFTIKSDGDRVTLARFIGLLRQFCLEGSVGQVGGVVKVEGVAGELVGSGGRSAGQ